MPAHKGRQLYSATDLVNFLRCTHATALDLRQLTEPVKVDPDSAYAKPLQKKGLAHGRAYLKQLRERGRSIAALSNEGSLEDRAVRTIDAMRSGIDVIYQGHVLSDPWHGHADFLLRADVNLALANGHTMLPMP
jgi:uncharacterized protein